MGNSGYEPREEAAIDAAAIILHFMKGQLVRCDYDDDSPSKKYSVIRRGTNNRYDDDGTPNGYNISGHGVYIYELLGTNKPGGEREWEDYRRLETDDDDGLASNIVKCIQIL